MSLDYDLTRIVNREVHLPAEENGNLNAAVQTMIWATIPVGINEITTANALEFHKRMTLWIDNIGPFFTRVLSDNELVSIRPTFEQVMSAAGLHTNASRKTRVQFMSDFRRLYFGE